MSPPRRRLRMNRGTVAYPCSPARPAPGPTPIRLVFRSDLFGRRLRARFERGDNLLEQPADPLRRRSIDRPGVDEEIEPGAVLADHMRLLPGLAHPAFHRVGHDRMADALEGDRFQRPGANTVAHENKGLVTQHNSTRLRDRLKARRQIDLGADDSVVHPVVAAEIADVAEAGSNAHAGAEG